MCGCKVLSGHSRRKTQHSWEWGRLRTQARTRPEALEVRTHDETVKGESTETPEKGAVQHHGAYLDVSGEEKKRDGTKVIRDMEVSPEDSVPRV